MPGVSPEDLEGDPGFLDAATFAAADDYFLPYDDSANSLRPMTAANLLAVLDAQRGIWTDFVPTLSGGWLLGNSTYQARYTKVGRTVFFYAVITIGSSATKGTTLTAALPVEATADAGMFCSVRALFHDVGTAAFIGLPSFPSSTLAATSTVTFVVENASTTYVSQTGITSSVPFTWVTGDRICYGGHYEASA